MVTAHVSTGLVQVVRSSVRVSDVAARRGVALRRAGRELIGKCPFHEDGTPSFRINDEKNVWNCSPCEAQGRIGQIPRDAIGFVMQHDKLTFSEAVERIAKEHGLSASEEKPRHVATYEWHDADGRVVAIKKRWEPAHDRSGKPKSMTWHGPDGSGWTRPSPWTPTLYHLPTVLRAIREGRTIFVVEGEKCVEYLERHGLVATTNEDGAGAEPKKGRAATPKWRPQHAGLLRGARVVVIPDCDNPGRIHAAAIRASLEGLAQVVAVLELDEVKKGSGADDWLAAGHTVEELVALAQDALQRAEAADPTDHPDGVPDDAPAKPKRVRRATPLEAYRLMEMYVEGLQLQERRGLPLVTKPLPWSQAPLRAPRQLVDDDLLGCQLWLEEVHRVTIGIEHVHRSLNRIAAAHPYEPVCDYLRSLKWDGVDRATKWLRTYMGADTDRDNIDYIDAVGWSWLVQAVARAMKPGCVAQHVLTLEGEQGIGKSRGLKALVTGDDPDCEWFGDHLAAVGSQVASMQLARAWVFELGELAAVSRAEELVVKNWLTQSDDEYKRPYGRQTVTIKRACVFTATTNDHAALKDPTGARRWWPVRVRAVDVEAILRDRDQLWAQAMDAYSRKQQWHLPKEMELLAREAQASRHVEDPWTERLREKLGELTPRPLTGAEILTRVLGVEEGRQTKADAMRVASAMQRMGWARKKMRCAGGPPQWHYVPPEDA